MIILMEGHGHGAAAVIARTHGMGSGGRAVAQLGPVEATRAQVTIDDLAARGLVEPARRGDRPAEPDVRIDAWTGGRLDRALREVRGA